MSRNQSSTQSASRTVKQVSMVHNGEIPDQRPQIFEITSEAEEEYEAGYFGNVLRVEEFDLSSGEESYK